jgi:Tfp pilus assembly protein PilX
MKPQRNQTNSFLMLLLLRLQSGQSRSSGGYTLVITIAVLLVLSVLLITYAITSKVDNVSSTASAKSNTGFYNAEAGLNQRAENIRAKFVGYSLPKGTSPTDWKACVTPGVPPSALGTDDFMCETDANIGVQPVSTYVEDLTQKVPISIVIPEGELFSGLSAQEYRYNVISIAQDKQMQPTAILGMQFKSRLIPLFQFAAFYDQDMDVQLPPTMTLNGPVHSNNDMYLDASSIGPATLTIEGQVTAAGSLYRGEKQDSTCSGRVDIYDPTNAKDLPCSGSRQVFPTSALKAWNNRIRVGVQPLKLPDAGEFNAASGGRYWDAADLRIALDLTTTPPSVQVRTKGDISDPSGTSALTSTTCAPIQAPISSISGSIVTLSTAPSPSFSAGDFVTLGDDPHIYFVQSAAGALVTLAATSTAPVPATVVTGTILRKAIVSYSENTFKNYREKRGNFGTGPKDHTPIKLLNVDIRGLLGCASNLMGVKALDDDTEGGLVWFLTVKGPDSNPTPPASNDYGVRIYNGQDLSTPVAGVSIKGLSVVSDQAVYIRGDYNCGSSTTCNNGNNDDDIRKPAAVMADTINVLSNNWTLDDAYSNEDISSGPSFGNKSTLGRPATSTTIDAAFLAGIDITGDANRKNQNQGYATAGGGLNNYPRFHEDWSNGYSNNGFVDFTYQGSMVSLGAPRKVNGRWCGSGSLADCNIYNPPNRLWRYDPLFNNAANLPPLTPRAVFLKQELFSRNFEQAARPMPELWAMLSPTHWLGALTTLLQTHR